MLQQEFEQLTGFNPTAGYFNEVIHPMYMKSDLDKQAWCKAWKKNGGIQAAYNYIVSCYEDVSTENTSIANALEEACNERYDLRVANTNLNDLTNNLKKQIEDLNTERRLFAIFLVEQAEKYGSPEMRQQAIGLMGESAYLKFKIENNMTLWEDDKVLLYNILNENK